MDRVHRIGQQRQVTIYRLVCSNTVEERILIRAQQKHAIQSTVYAGGFKMMNETRGKDNEKLELQDLFSENELKTMLDAEGIDTNNGPNTQPDDTTITSIRTSPASSPSPTVPISVSGIKHKLEETNIKQENALKRQRYITNGK
jgi:hypothetical protein